MCVDLQRDPHVGVTEALRQHLHWHAIGERRGRVAVPQVMQPNARQAGRGREIVEQVAERLRIRRTAIGERHDEAVGGAASRQEADGLRPSTVARRLATLASFYRYVVDEGVLESSPLSNVRRPRAGEGRVELTPALDRDDGSTVGGCD